jgi:hypothetical protein
LATPKHLETAAVRGVGRDPRPGAHAAARHVALLFGSFRAGGVARVMLLTAEQLLARSFAVDLVVAQATGELSGAVPERARVVELDRASEWRAYRAF